MKLWAYFPRTDLRYGFNNRCILVKLTNFCISGFTEKLKTDFYVLLQKDSKKCHISSPSWQNIFSLEITGTNIYFIKNKFINLQENLRKIPSINEVKLYTRLQIKMLGYIK